MLIDVMSGKTYDQVPYGEQFDQLRARLSDDEFEGMVDRINELIDEAGAEIATAGWLPGSDWTGTPFLPIYIKAARQNYDISARFFGQLVWFTVMHRDDTWASGRYEKNGKEIGSRTYFRVEG